MSIPLITRRQLEIINRKTLQYPLAITEKIRAMNDRVRYRDFYDFSMINKKLSINLKGVIGLVKQKEIRKPISPKNIKSNWQLAKSDNQNDLQ